MPFKHNASRRRHIEKTKFRVTNWAEYEAGLRLRGSLTLWLTPEARSKWYDPRRKTRGGQHRYSDLAIDTPLTLGLVYDLRLRQAEGLLESVLHLMGLSLAVPDHTTLSRRARTWQSPNERRDPRSSRVTNRCRRSSQQANAGSSSRRSSGISRFRVCVRNPNLTGNRR